MLRRLVGFGVVAALALICSAAFFAYSTLRGPQFEEDPAKREAQQVRNRALGLLVFGIVWVVTVLWLRDLLLRLPLIPLYAALGGFLAGAFIGVAGVWYLHHRRGGGRRITRGLTSRSDVHAEGHCSGGISRVSRMTGLNGISRRGAPR